MGKSKCLIIYRGPLERSRLAFIFDSMDPLFDELSFLWLLPHEKFYNENNKRFDEFIIDFPRITYSVISAGSKDILTDRKKIRQLGKETDTIVMVGLTTPFFVPNDISLKKIWFINGIPEEKLLHNNTFNVKAGAWLRWNLLKSFAKPDIIITVSTRMSAYVSEYFPDVALFAAPTCVDLSVFKNSEVNPRNYFTYLGSGAPWQNLALLSKIWQEIHNQNPNIKFRVISRDTRTQILSTGIAPSSIEFVGSENFEEIADFLKESEVGFLIRENNLINRVSFPTKLAEYLASGSWVVASDIDWDISDIIKKYDVGLLINPESKVKEIAAEILEKRKGVEDGRQLKLNIEKSLLVLHREYWIKETQSFFSRFMKKLK